MPRLSPRTIQLLLLALITMAHVATRLESLRQYPLGKRLFFPESFRYSLAVMAGLGLNPVPFSGDPTSIPLQDFLAVQSEGISAQEFEAWKQSRLSAETVHDSPLTYEDQHLTWPLYTTRVLDLPRFKDWIFKKTAQCTQHLIGTYCGIGRCLAGLLRQCSRHCRPYGWRRCRHQRQ